MQRRNFIGLVGGWLASVKLWRPWPKQELLPLPEEQQPIAEPFAGYEWASEWETVAFPYFNVSTGQMETGYDAHLVPKPVNIYHSADGQDVIDASLHWPMPMPMCHGCQCAFSDPYIPNPENAL
jgi:hypothetical protein